MGGSRIRTSEEVMALTSLAMQILHQMPADPADAQLVLEMVQELRSWNEEKLRALTAPIMKVVR